MYHILRYHIKKNQRFFIGEVLHVPRYNAEFLSCYLFLFLFLMFADLFLAFYKDMAIKQILQK